MYLLDFGDSMVKLENAVTARYEREGHKFEILVDPYLALELKQGKEINFDDLLAIDEVFKDASKGDKQSENLLEEIFGTQEIIEVSKKIIKDGEVQLTTDLRREILEKKRKEVIDYISTNAYDPKTKAPHPPARIENAIAELKFSIDLHKNAIEQANALVKEMKVLLPITMEKVKLAIKVPAEHAGKASSIVHKYDVLKEQWQGDGSLIVTFEISAGTKTVLLNELNHLTHGDLESKILEE